MLRRRRLGLGSNENGRREPNDHSYFYWRNTAFALYTRENTNICTLKNGSLKLYFIALIRFYFRSFSFSFSCLKQFIGIYDNIFTMKTLMFDKSIDYLFPHCILRQQLIWTVQRKERSHQENWGGIPARVTTITCYGQQLK